MIFSFDIDEKSLFRGIKNDYKKGQSATVATPLNQAKNPSNWRNAIYDFFKGYPTESINALPATLKDKCLKQTTSKASTKLVYFNTFSKFSLDGTAFEADASFAFYVKEEISNTIIRRDGSSGYNTHLGRQRLCYPLALNHHSDGYNIDNSVVLNKILEVNGGFAYVVNGFDIDTEEKSLNFRTTMVGIKGVLLSNVFRRGKGVGVKLNVNGVNFDSTLISQGNDTFLSTTESNTFFKTLEKIQTASRANGLKGEEYVFDNITKILHLSNIESSDHISKKYPQSPYDIEYSVGGVKKYIEVKSTSGDKKIFMLSKGERRFMEKYDKDYTLVLVINVTSNHRRTFLYTRREIENTHIMEQEYQSIKYIVKD